MISCYQTQVHVPDAQWGQTIAKRWNLQQRKVYCRAPARRQVAHALKTPNSSRAFSKALFQERGMVSCRRFLGVRSFVLFFFFLRFFWCGSFLKSLMNLLQYYFCFMFRFCVHEAYRILVPLPGIGIEPESPALEGEVLTTGPPGKSQVLCSWGKVMVRSRCSCKPSPNLILCSD